MKIDRILGIIIYLLNHDKVSAKTLAEKYNVSVRTVQRDMVNIASTKDFLGLWCDKRESTGSRC